MYKFCVYWYMKNKELEPGSFELCSDALTTELASYPGLLTPTFVACNASAGEGLVKLSHVQ